MASWIDWFNSESLARIEQSLESLHKKANKIMAQVQVAQEDLNALDTSLNQVTADITTHINALVAAAQAGEPLPQADLTALQEDVAALQALSAPTPNPDDQPHPDQTLPGDL